MDYTESRFNETIFSPGYGAERAFHDGQADELIKLYNIMRTINE